MVLRSISQFSSRAIASETPTPKYFSLDPTMVADAAQIPQGGETRLGLGAFARGTLEHTPTPARRPLIVVRAAVRRVKRLQRGAAFADDGRQRSRSGKNSRVPQIRCLFRPNMRLQ